jgi:4'-phosphopantetheinyl transferase
MDSQGKQPQISITELSLGRILDSGPPELTATSIHIWQIPLTISEVPLQKFSALLSEDETVRAARFRFEKDARRFTVARASARLILGGYVGLSGSDLRFHYAHHGKPALANAGRDVGFDVRFSVSHSGELALLAVALRREVGVDLEAIRENVETDTLAERYFSERERTSLRVLSHGQRVRAFFRCWTCKEAFLKGQGLGLSRSLGSFDVEVNPQHPARLLATRPDEEEAQRWSLQDVPTEPNYTAAVAWEVSTVARGSLEMKILQLR